jgi:hypothetical protein
MSSAHLPLERAVGGTALAVTEIALKVLVRNQLAAMSAEPFGEGFLLTEAEKPPFKEVQRVERSQVPQKNGAEKGDISMSYLYVKWNSFRCGSLADGSVIRAWVCLRWPLP